MDALVKILKKNPKIFKFVKVNVNKAKKHLYKYAKNFIRVDEKMVIFDAFLGKSYACNPRSIYEEMISLDEFKDWNFIWVMKKPQKLQLEKGVTVRYNSLKHYYYLAKSKYWVFNSKMPQYMHKKKSQVYLQTWHGTPLKKLARDIEIGEEATFYRSKMSKEEMVKTYDEDVKRYDFLISPNPFSTEKFVSAFGIDKEKIIETGYPRNDILVNYTQDQIEKIKNRLGIDKSKKVVLYAPTWRDNIYDVKGYSFTPKVDFYKWKSELGEDYVVIYKPHYLIVNDIYDERLEGFVYFSKATDNINDLYLVSDVLITDYSSVFFDYSVLRRPMLYYMFDLESYKNELRGFYFDIKELPGPIIEDENILIDNIKNIEDISSRFAEKYNIFTDKMCSLEDGRSTKRVIEKVFGINTEKSTYIDNA